MIGLLNLTKRIIKTFMKFHWQLTKFDFVQFITKMPDAELIH